MALTCQLSACCTTNAIDLRGLYRHPDAAITSLTPACPSPASIAGRAGARTNEARLWRRRWSARKVAARTVVVRLASSAHSSGDIVEVKYTDMGTARVLRFWIITKAGHLIACITRLTSAAGWSAQRPGSINAGTSSVPEAGLTRGTIRSISAIDRAQLIATAGASVLVSRTQPHVGRAQHRRECLHGDHAKAGYGCRTQCDHGVPPKRLDGPSATLLT
jgi:hypothetical protein